jgi:hypothetical protein
VKFLTSIVLACLLLVACGSDKPPLTSQASLLLRVQISDARTSASNGDATGAIAKLDGVSQQLGQLQQRGLVTDARARAIAAAIDTVRSALQSGSVTTPPTEPTTEPSTEAPTVSTESSTTTTQETTTEPSTSTSSPPTSDTTGKGGKGGGKGNGD